MSLFNVFNIASSSLSAESQRLNAIASNLANADSITSADGTPYKAKQVSFKPTSIDGSNFSGVMVDKVIEDQTPARTILDPGNPLANKDGYVTMPNVNVAQEMVNMISTTRSYQNSVEAMNATKSLLQKALSIGQG
jgi:flagellar basal-body rod protein FlgC